MKTLLSLYFLAHAVFFGILVLHGQYEPTHVSEVIENEKIIMEWADFDKKMGIERRFKNYDVVIRYKGVFEKPVERRFKTGIKFYFEKDGEKFACASYLKPGMKLKMYTHTGEGNDRWVHYMQVE